MQNFNSYTKFKFWTQIRNFDLHLKISVHVMTISLIYLLQNLLFSRLGSQSCQIGVGKKPETTGRTEGDRWPKAEPDTPHAEEASSGQSGKGQLSSAVGFLRKGPHHVRKYEYHRWHHKPIADSKGPHWDLGEDHRWVQWYDR